MLLKQKSNEPYLRMGVTTVITGMCGGSRLTRPWIMSCTDGRFGSHPRAAGTYAELIQRYVVEKGVLTLAAFIRRSTSLVAETYHIKVRGVIRRGAFADITIFRPAEVRANATYSDPKLLKM